MNNRYYTKQEEKTILREVERHPENLAKAFAIAAKKIGRSEKAVTQHWYNSLRKTSNTFLLSSAKKTVVNSKLNGNTTEEERYTALQLFVKKLFKL